MSTMGLASGPAPQLATAKTEHAAVMEYYMKLKERCIAQALSRTCPAGDVLLQGAAKEEATKSEKQARAYSDASTEYPPSVACTSRTSTDMEEILVPSNTPCISRMSSNASEADFGVVEDAAGTVRAEVARLRNFGPSTPVAPRGAKQEDLRWPAVAPAESAARLFPATLRGARREDKAHRDDLAGELAAWEAYRDACYWDAACSAAKDFDGLWEEILVPSNTPCISRMSSQASEADFGLVGNSAGTAWAEVTRLRNFGPSTPVAPWGAKQEDPRRPAVARVARLFPATLRGARREDEADRDDLAGELAAWEAYRDACYWDAACSVAKDFDGLWEDAVQANVFVARKEAELQRAEAPLLAAQESERKESEAELEAGLVDAELKEAQSCKL